MDNRPVLESRMSLVESLGMDLVSGTSIGRKVFGKDVNKEGYSNKAVRDSGTSRIGLLGMSSSGVDGRRVGKYCDSPGRDSEASRTASFCMNAGSSTGQKEPKIEENDRVSVLAPR